jgi:hypothetical protein
LIFGLCAFAPETTTTDAADGDAGDGSSAIHVRRRRRRSVGDAERVDPSTDETRDGRVDYNQRHPRDDAHFIDLISLIVDRNAEEKTRETSEDDAGGGGVWNDDDGGDVDAMGDAG